MRRALVTPCRPLVDACRRAGAGVRFPPLPLDPARLALIEPLVEEAIAAGQIPGAVVIAGRGDQVLYRFAFGHRAVQPSPEAMTIDTIFDVASLTKVVATTTAVMALVEDGRIRLTDRVSAYVPGFERYGKDKITIRHLLTHVSGLRPDLDLGVEFDGGAAEAIRLAREEVPVAPPGERFIYSDIGFFLLGHIVEVVSKQTLPAFVQARAFGPLGMTDTSFCHPRRCGSASRRLCLRAAGLALHGARRGHAARRRPRPDGPPDGRRCGSRGPVQHGGRPGDLRPHDPRRRQLERHPRAVAPHSRRDDQAGDACRQCSRCEAWVGISTPATRPTVATCCRSARLATRGSPARRCGSTRSLARS